ncbi:hypothetical protein ACVWYN_002962 [Pedobacter sp. UYP24]
MNAFKFTLSILLFTFAFLHVSAQKYGENGTACVVTNKYNLVQRLKMYPFNKAVKVKAIAYENVNGEVRDTSKIMNFGLHLKGGKLDSTSIAFSTTLNDRQIDKLSAIFFNTGFKGAVGVEDFGARFIPRNAFIFLDKDDNVIDYLEVCFECSRNRSLSDKDIFGVACSQKYDMLRAFLRDIKIPIFSPKYDLDHFCKECKWNEFPDIKKSTNDIEVRFRANGHAGPNYTAILAKNTEKYEAFLYKREHLMAVYEKTGDYDSPMLKYKITDHDLDSVMKAITAIGVFTLPSQTVRDSLYNGNFLIETKKGTEYRTYGFAYPDEWIKKYPDVDLYKSYKLLTDLFFKFWRGAIKEMSDDESRRYREEQAQEFPDPADAEADKFINQLFGGKG